MAANRVEFYKDTADEWRWRYVAGNNEIMANSGEGYKNRDDCLNAIQLVLDAFLSTLTETAAGELVEVLTPMASRMPLAVKWIDKPQ